MKFLYILIIQIILITPAIADWNKGETELLNLAYQEGKKINHPELLQILMMNETVVGRWGRYGDDHFKDWRLHCFGVMQMQFRTARWVVDTWTNYKLNDVQLVKRLRFDDAFAIELSSVMIEKYLKPYFGDDLKKLILAYNTGPAKVLAHGLNHDPQGYLKRGLRNLRKYIVPFNKKQGNGCIVEYKIKEHDTLFKIAANLLTEGKRWREILEINSDLDPNNLKIGRTILIKR